MIVDNLSICSLTSVQKSTQGPSLSKNTLIFNKRDSKTHNWFWNLIMASFLYDVEDDPHSLSTVHGISSSFKHLSSQAAEIYFRGDVDVDELYLQELFSRNMVWTKTWIFSPVVTKCSKNPSSFSKVLSRGNEQKFQVFLLTITWDETCLQDEAVNRHFSCSRKSKMSSVTFAQYPAFLGDCMFYERKFWIISNQAMFNK